MKSSWKIYKKGNFLLCIISGEQQNKLANNFPNINFISSNNFSFFHSNFSSNSFSFSAFWILIKIQIFICAIHLYILGSFFFFYIIIIFFHFSSLTNLNIITIFSYFPKKKQKITYLIKINGVAQEINLCTSGNSQWNSF